MFKEIEILREKCQLTRPSIFSDRLSKIYYFFSIYFTWLLLKLKFSSNKVTLLSGVVCLLAGYLFFIGDTISVVFGSMLLVLFAILDMSDGEVARYHNSGSMEGHYLDWVMHFVYSSSISVGFATNLVFNGSSFFFIFLGILYVVLSILDKAIQSSTWTVIAWTALRNKNKKRSFKISKNHQEEIGSGNTRAPFRIFKFLIVAPVQDHWIPIFLPIAVLLHKLLEFSGMFPSTFQEIWAVYAVSILSILIIKNVCSLMTSNRMRMSYNKLMHGKNIRLPNDDFV
jgi:phosphatidylglycerophosphate synthase